MSKVSVLRTALFVVCFVGCFICGCASEQAPVSEFPPEELLAAGKLELVWQSKLPTKEAEYNKRLLIFRKLKKSPEKIEELYIFGNRIYALTDENYFVSLNRKTGAVVFSVDLDDPGVPVFGMDIYKNELFSIIGNRLVQINNEYGTNNKVTRLGLGITCPAARNREYFYVGSSDRRLHAFRAKDMVKVFDVSADNASMITAISADERSVVFGTEAGDVISITPDRRTQLWEFPAGRSIVGPIRRDGRALYFASKNTNVYKINGITGRFIWKYQTGAVLNKAPVVSDDVVYQPVRNKGLSAIDKRTGELIWEVPHGVGLLAEANGRAYVITSRQRLVVMDNQKARQLYSLNLAGASIHATNLSDSNIYIADDTGRIVCLRPLE